jgi:hypothetical protein
VATLRKRLADLQKEVAALRSPDDDCPGPPILFGEGTLAELEALPIPEKCHLCGEVHGGDRPRFIWVVREESEREMEATCL